VLQVGLPKRGKSSRRMSLKEGDTEPESSKNTLTHSGHASQETIGKTDWGVRKTPMGSGESLAFLWGLCHPDRIKGGRVSWAWREE